MSTRIKVMEACRACPLRARADEGHAPCKVDMVDWRHHTRAGYCPHPDKPQFGKGVKPEGWDQHPQVPSAWRRRRKSIRLPGPGDALAGAIKVATLGRVKMCATCKSRRATMNGWGWWETLRHPVRTVRLFYSNE